MVIKLMEPMKTFPYGKTNAVVLSCSRNNTIAYELHKSLRFNDTREVNEEGDYYGRLDF